ncbi:alpha/beta fold hydrolase [Novosphingobium album (ex Liu et al. 2023)]|uniref:Alpha/beta hydrolase n=1 Tax=Novosphingobium album (ex Liu et al. 2023) TaxID=3031130 RepID=A0ABT5WX39_9SPHN|nr:alpha/beta hydrolase [Novosphingobium album (ex Liu et al. 2023)]MDE8654419.1 alpha/beta hydrolase [Novosphingobium album (ex Liu et al. 2023)]
MSEAIGEDADPAEVLAALEARARRVDTPCGEGTMAWRIWGEGEPLVLAHGAQGSWTHWVRNIARLAASGRMVIAADLPGHGDSAMPETPDHAGISKALATGLRAILGERLPVDLCGFSFGGVAFAYLAALHPDVARHLVLIGCGGLDTPKGQIHLGRVGGLAGEERIAAMTANLLGLMLHHRESVDAMALHQLMPNARKARLNVPDLVVPDRLVQILPEVRVPVDAIWGELDRPHPHPALQEAVLRRIQPETQFRVIADAGHWAMYERPEAFERALGEILNAPPRTVG